MRRKVTKAAALLSAVLMASSSVPYGVLIPYNVLAEEVSADAGAAVQEETAATVGSVTNIKTWDAAGLLAAAATEDNGLSLKGDGWTTGTDTAGAEAFGTGDYVKAGGVKPTPNNGAIPTAGCYLQYTATESGKLTIMEKTQKTNKSFYVVDSDGVVKDTKTSGSASTYDTITIDVGEKDGIQKDQAVVSVEGLIGKVVEVSKYTSKVKLLTSEDKLNTVSIKVLDEDGNASMGILESYDVGKGRYVITLFDEGAEIKKGMTVMTSGNGGVYPSGLLIGEVESVQALISQTGQTIYAKPIKNFQSFEYVSVVVPKGDAS